MKMRHATLFLSCVLLLAGSAQALDPAALPLHGLSGQVAQKAFPASRGRSPSKPGNEKTAPVPPTTTGKKSAPVLQLPPRITHKTLPAPKAGLPKAPGKGTDPVRKLPTPSPNGHPKAIVKHASPALELPLPSGISREALPSAKATLPRTPGTKSVPKLPLPHGARSKILPKLPETMRTTGLPSAKSAISAEKGTPRQKLPDLKAKGLETVPAAKILSRASIPGMKAAGEAIPRAGGFPPPGARPVRMDTRPAIESVANQLAGAVAVGSRSCLVVAGARENHFLLRGRGFGETQGRLLIGLGHAARLNAGSATRVPVVEIQRWSDTEIAFTTGPISPRTGEEGAGVQSLMFIVGRSDELGETQVKIGLCPATRELAIRVVVPEWIEVACPTGRAELRQLVTGRGPGRRGSDVLRSASIDLPRPSRGDAVTDRNLVMEWARPANAIDVVCGMIDGRTRSLLARPIRFEFGVFESRKAIQAVLLDTDGGPETLGADLDHLRITRAVASWIGFGFERLRFPVSLLVSISAPESGTINIGRYRLQVEGPRGTATFPIQRRRGSATSAHETAFETEVVLDAIHRRGEEWLFGFGDRVHLRIVTAGSSRTVLSERTIRIPYPREWRISVQLQEIRVEESGDDDLTRGDGDWDRIMLMMGGSCDRTIGAYVAETGKSISEGVPDNSRVVPYVDQMLCITQVTGPFPLTVGTIEIHEDDGASTMRLLSTAHGTLRLNHWRDTGVHEVPIRGEGLRATAVFDVWIRMPSSYEGELPFE